MIRQGSADVPTRKCDPQNISEAPSKNCRLASQHAMEVSSETSSRSLESSLVEGNYEKFSFLQPAESPAELGWLGHFRVIRLLGKGGMGLVFLAEDSRLQRSVALKVLRPDFAPDPTARQRFLREARATATIRSDHIVIIHEVGQINDVPYIATELLEGQPLDMWLKHAPRLTFDRVVDLGVQIARGLEAAHKSGVIHRDIKPANLWMEPTGRIKILDFGLARTGNQNVNLTQTGTLLGTPAYMAPEQAAGKQVDGRCDLFSLGCVLYEAATGEKPFSGSSVPEILIAMAATDPASPQDHNPALPPAFCNLITRLLAKDPANRPDSASSVLEALTSITAEAQPTQTIKALSSVGRQKPFSNANIAPRRRIVIGVGLAALTLLVSLFAVMGFQFPHGASPDTASSATFSNRARMHAVTTAQGVSDGEILLGMTGPFSGPSLELGHNMEVGIRTYFRFVNDEGGIAGRKLNLVVLDDGYQPDRALANMKELYAQRKVFAVIGNVGTPTAEQTLPYAVSKEMIFFGAFTGAPLLRNTPPDKYVFNYRPSYAEETASIVKYMIEVKSLGPEQIAVFAQQDGYGDAGFHGVVKMLRKYGRRAQDILRVGHARNSVDVYGAVKEILRHQEIRGIVMVSTYRPACQFIRQLKDAKADLLFANVSFVGADALAEELRQFHPDYADGVIVSQVVPHPDSQSSMAIKYRELQRKYYPNETPNFGALEGYINAAIFAEGLRQAGPNLTTASLVNALETIGNFDLGLGTTLHYSASEHQASHKVWGTCLDKSGHYRILELE